MADLKAIKLPADTSVHASIVRVNASSFDHNDPSTMNYHVGGWCEFVSLPPWFMTGRSVKLVVDEEGLLKGKVYNPRASTFYAGPQIVGDALLIGWTEQHEPCDISDEWIQTITDAEGVEALTEETSDQKI